MDEREVKRFTSYKDLAYRSLNYLYDKVGEDKLNEWLEEWFIEYYAVQQLKIIEGIEKSTKKVSIGAKNRR